jgi:hypothetical protein
MECLGCKRPKVETGDRFTRGLCRACYMAANRAVLAREVKWSELEAAGKCRKRTRRLSWRYKFFRIQKEKL